MKFLARHNKMENRNRKVKRIYEKAEDADRQCGG